jgi:1,4-dihydroxy-6-naphthoate synthase
MFDQIPEEVAAGRVAAGLLIHEGQLTYRQHGLHRIVDLGVWWQQRTGLPLPLGGNAIRRDLGERTCREVVALVRRSIRYALDHRAEAVRYALQFGRGLDVALADRFVGMYVNEWTLDYGPRGRAAVHHLLHDAAVAELVPVVGDVEFIE